MPSILLIDDSKEDQELFAEAISKLSLPVNLKILKNGADLIDYLYSDAPLPDMIFLDLYMPVVNGEECLKEIRQESQFDSIPILIYSNVYEISMIERLFEMGANRFLQKPNSFADLVYSLEISIKSMVKNGQGGKAVYRIFS